MDADAEAISPGIDPAQALDPLVLAIDVGTSSARALVYDARGRRVPPWEIHRPYQVQTTPDGGVVMDADALLSLVAECVDGILAALPAGRTPAAVAFDTFWHSLMGTDDQARAITPVYTWADTRSKDAAKALRRRLNEDEVHERTGCALHSSYWPAKLLWLDDTDPALRRQVRHWMSFAEYLYLHLFGELRVSISMASGTGLFDQNGCTWDRELLEVLPIEEVQLSPLADFSDVLTNLRPPFDRRWPRLRSIPWYLGIGDGAANNVGSGGFCSDYLVAMVGTSGAIRVVEEAERVRIPPGLWTYRVDKRRFVQGGALSDGGNVFAWLTHVLQLPQMQDLESDIAVMRPDGHGLTILPFLAGERSPGWNPDAHAVFSGMTLATKPVDLVRASLEAVAYRFGLVYDVLKPFIPAPRGIIGSGAGLIHSPAWLQIMTDVLGEPLTVSAVPEASSRGAALLVLESSGAISGLSEAPAPFGATYHPDPERTAVYKAAMERQRRLYHALMAGTQEGGTT